VPLAWVVPCLVLSSLAAIAFFVVLARGRDPDTYAVVNHAWLWFGSSIGATWCTSIAIVAAIDIWWPAETSKTGPIALTPLRPERREPMRSRRLSHTVPLVTQNGPLALLDGRTALALPKAPAKPNGPVSRRRR
jgi:hypothetical protein